MSKPNIFIAGATGRTGGAAIDELLKMGKLVRAYVRSDDQRAAVLRQRGADIAIGDFTNLTAATLVIAPPMPTSTSGEGRPSIRVNSLTRWRPVRS